MKFNRDIFKIDPEAEARKIAHFIREITLKNFKRRGAVVGLSGGIDSAVVAELCVYALGKDKVLGLIIPEKESNPISRKYAQKQADKMGIQATTVDITENLKSLGLYKIRNAVIKQIFPEFDGTFKFHITLPQNLLERDRLNYHSITIEDENGIRQTKRLSGKDWIEISACQNMKQRIRMIRLYHYAEKNNYIVAGTTNKPEAMQGFYVKFGDGGVDIEPIAHLYKIQVYELARHLGVIEEIISRPPSPDTYSLPVTDKEFYFCLKYELLDFLLYAYENNLPFDDISNVLELKQEQIERVFKDFRAKERASWHLRESPPSLS
ncbi:MAG: NAD(+) synthase [Desulfobacterales bacterium S5133MH4]|jgi:NAD+ synthase|nr:MAG: NAD(+) synthase [Desulfobacterales bacterium S5133MH4]